MPGLRSAPKASTARRFLPLTSTLGAGTALPPPTQRFSKRRSAPASAASAARNTMLREPVHQTSLRSASVISASLWRWPDHVRSAVCRRLAVSTETSKCGQQSEHLPRRDDARRLTVARSATRSSSIRCTTSDHPARCFPRRSLPITLPLVAAQPGDPEWSIPSISFSAKLLP
jgi:hypothetical protein